MAVILSREDESTIKNEPYYTSKWHAITPAMVCHFQNILKKSGQQRGIQNHQYRLILWERNILHYM